MLITTEDADVDTGLGVMRMKIFRPKDESRAWPGLVLWSEIFAITGPIARAAQIFAGNGFTVAVPEFYHGFLAPGAALAYTPEDTQKGNDYKAAKELASYDADISAALAWVLASPHCNGAVGTAGFCIGGALAFRTALHPSCKAAVCWYATDVHKGGRELAPALAPAAPPASACPLHPPHSAPLKQCQRAAMTPWRAWARSGARS